MHTNEPRELQGVELGYDPRDIDSKGIAKIVIWFFALTILAYGAVALTFVWRGWGEKSVRDPRKPAFAGPKVQGNIAAKVDIMEMRQTERRLMSTYEPLKDGRWRIPVARAMGLVAQEGLPEVTSDQRAVSPGNTIPQNATGPAGASTTTTPSESAPGEDRLKGLEGGATGAQTSPGTAPNTPDAGQGAAGGTAGGAGTGGASGP